MKEISMTATVTESAVLTAKLPSVAASPQVVDLRRVGSQRASVSMCIPARNEATTIAALVAQAHSRLVRRGIVDEIVVMDDRSDDATASVASAAGARVVSTNSVMKSFGPSLGKGDAMWRSLAVTTGDIVLFCDGDLQAFDVTRLEDLVCPLLNDRWTMMSKGFFRRLDADGEPGPGGRVTGLVARPLLSLLFPQVSDIYEPLSGMYAIRRHVAEGFTFEADYGVDVGLLLDTVRKCGRGSVAQVDLGTLRHTNQSLDSLAGQAAAVERSILTRAGLQRNKLGTRMGRPGGPFTNISSSVRPAFRTVDRAYADAMLDSATVDAVC